MVCYMKKRIATVLAAAAVLPSAALPAGALAAKPVNYKGKTSSGPGHLSLGRARSRDEDFVTGAPVTGASRSGHRPAELRRQADQGYAAMWFGINKTNQEWKSEKVKPAFHWREVTMNSG